jgi:hypothetical protein
MISVADAVIQMAVAVWIQTNPIWTVPQEVDKLSKYLFIPSWTEFHQIEPRSWANQYQLFPINYRSIVCAISDPAT